MAMAKITQKSRQRKALLQKLSRFGNSSKRSSFKLGIIPLGFLLSIALSIMGMITYANWAPIVEANQKVGILKDQTAGVIVDNGKSIPLASVGGYRASGHLYLKNVRYVVNDQEYVSEMVILNDLRVGTTVKVWYSVGNPEAANTESGLRASEYIDGAYRLYGVAAFSLLFSIGATIWVIKRKPASKKS